MAGSLFGNKYSRILQDTAKITAPDKATYERIFQSVVESAGAVGVAGAVGALGAASYTAGVAKAAALGKAGLAKTVGAVVASGAGAAVVATTIVVSPTITDLYVDNESGMVQQANIIIKVDTLVPVRSVVVIPDEGVPFAADPFDDNQYSAPVTENGTYTIEVTGPNGQTTSSSVEVDCIDREIPNIVNYSNDESHVYLYFEDAGSGVDWTSVYAVNGTGQIIKPLRIDEEAGLVVFELPEEDLELYLSDLAGNQAKSAIRISR